MDIGAEDRFSYVSYKPIDFAAEKRQSLQLKLQEMQEI